MTTKVRGWTDEEKATLHPLLRELHKHVETCAACAGSPVPATAAELDASNFCAIGAGLYRSWLSILSGQQRPRPKFDSSVFRRRREHVDELRVDIGDEGVVFELDVADHNDPTFEVPLKDAARLAEEILMCVGCRRARGVAKRILEWVAINDEADRKARGE